VSGSADGAVLLWNLGSSAASSDGGDTGASSTAPPIVGPRARMSGHVGRVSKVAFHPSGRVVASTGCVCVCACVGVCVYGTAVPAAVF
jgi:hypothetical protein